MLFRSPSLLLLGLFVAVGAAAAPSYPLSVAPDGRQILDAAGAPVFFNAATPWHIITRLDQAETIQYLDDRQARGFNSIMVSLLVDDEFQTRSSDNVFGDPPFDTPGDFSTPNAAYFAHVDWFLQAAEARGLTVFMNPAYIGWGCTIEGFCQEMVASGPTAMRDYGRWLGDRYKDQPNLVWVHGGDADATAHGALDVVDAVAEGIRERDPNHLHTAHCRRFMSGLECYDRPWLDFNTTYSDCTLTAQDIRQDYELTPPRPFVCLEGIYEYEFNWTDVCIRSQAYWSLLGGAQGHFFGNGTVWDFLGGWENDLESPGAGAMTHFGNLLHSRRWDLLVPDKSHQVLVDGYGDIMSADFAAAARTSDGHTAIIYTPKQRPLTVAMDQIAGSSVRAYWFSPADGNSWFAGTYPATGTHVFNPPFEGDCVLVLDDAMSNCRPPATFQASCNPTAAPETFAGSTAIVDDVAPNPFQSRTRITYSALRAGLVELDVYDARGRHVRQIVADRVAAGSYTVTWDGQDDVGRRVAAGVYRLVARTGSATESRSVVLFR